jgi:hypothetical protein
MVEEDRSSGEDVIKAVRLADESWAEGEIRRLFLGVEGTGNTGDRLTDTSGLEEAMLSAAGSERLRNKRKEGEEVAAGSDQVILCVEVL